MEKTKYEKALDKACDVLADSIDCTIRCPFDCLGKCGTVECHEKETWKEYFLKEVEKDE